MNNLLGPGDKGNWELAQVKKFNLNLILTRNIKNKEINQYLKVFKRNYMLKADYCKASKFTL